MRNKMTIDEVCKKVRSFMLENFLFGYDENEINQDASFLEIGALDSTGIMELVSLIEREFDIEVADNEIIPENLDSINFISQYVYRKIAAI